MEKKKGKREIQRKSVCVCVRERERERDTEKEREREGGRDTEKEREGEKEREREKCHKFACESVHQPSSQESQILGSVSSFESILESIL